jgi:hypothetical protein
MKAIITTQVYENYAWREDGSIGTGADAYFKPKGGDEYVVRNIDGEQVFEILEKVAGQIEKSNDYYQEFIVDIKIVEDDFLTEYELNQLEYEGRIVYSPKELELEFA